MAYINTSSGVKIIDFRVNRNIVDDLEKADHSDIVKLMILSYLESDHIIFDKIMSYNPDIINSFLHPNESITIFHIYDDNIRTKPEFTDILRKYSKNIRYINNVDGIYNNALMVSCINCDIEMIKFLLSITDNINRSNILGSTALHYVMKLHSRYGNRFMEVLNMFIGYGADLNKLDDYGFSPLGDYIKTSEYLSLDIDFIGKMISIGASIHLGSLSMNQNLYKAELIYYLIKEGLIDFKDDFLYHLPTIKYSSSIFYHVVNNKICSPRNALKSLLNINVNRKSDKIHLISKIFSIIYSLDDDSIDDDLESVVECARLKFIHKLIEYKCCFKNRQKKEDEHVQENRFVNNKVF
ncbi:MAG: hypothetical protein QXD03_03230 [Candidatus Anstonellales archaeon]